MSDRATDLAAFLAGIGWAEATIRPLAGDASNRRYLRLAKPGRMAVLMDAPPERGEDVRPFAAVTAWLLDGGFKPPAIFGMDPDRGFLLLEDLGDRLFARHLNAHPTEEESLYLAAVETLARLGDIPTPDALGPQAWPLADYDGPVLVREASLLTDWYLPAASGSTVCDAKRSEFAALIDAATRPYASCRSTVVLRDYHAENLIWLPDQTGVQRVGLLDYQDALAGHPAYDLVSLLEDARRDTTEALRNQMIDAYLALKPLLDPDDFRSAYASFGAQRNLKIIGIFTRLALRDRKPDYLVLIPRVWDHLQRDLQHPALSGLRTWIETHVPAPDPSTLSNIRQQVPR